MPRDFLPLKMSPGLVQGESPASNPGRWYDGNLVRWESDSLYPLGGWSEYTPASTVASPIRKVSSWVDNSGIRRIALLCERNLYIIEGDTLIDITPAGGFLNIPNIPNIGGYGTGSYGTGPYGTLRAQSDTFKYVPDVYTLENWGQTLVAMTSFDGRLLQWDPALPAGSKAVAVSGAPTNNRTFVVTDERHVVLWGIGGAKNSFGWCSQENINDWNFASVTNSAGQYDIEPSSQIITSIKCKTGVLFFTVNGAYILEYQGSPFIYTFRPVTDTAIPISPEAVVEYGGLVLWFSGSAFWRFDGSTAAPINCDLLDFLTSAIDIVYGRVRSFMVNIQSKNEIWFHYPSAGQTENNAFLIWNFADNWWSKGKLNRTCGFRASYTAYPMLANLMKLYFHERGGQYADYIELPYAISTALTTKSGAIKGTLKQMIVDNPDNAGSVNYSFTGRNRANPSVPSNNVVGPKLARSDGYLDVRITARDIQMKVQSVAANRNDWSFGIPLVDVKMRGAR